jgi:hypothetical protein
LAIKKRLFSPQTIIGDKNDRITVKRIKKELNFSPKVGHPDRLYGVKTTKIEAIENLTFGPV